jgi:XTP/dITP diphosphohydrolase
MRSQQVPTLVLASNNRHKIAEIRDILKRARLNVRLLPLDSFPGMPKVVENKPTIEGNAMKKAREVARRTGYAALADDTGLFIDALKGRPGVVSARFAGPACRYEDNNRKVLKLMEGVPLSKRGAVFRCVAALAIPGGRSFLGEGRIRGKIAFSLRGNHGFGYDPVFVVPRYRKTFAAMSPRLKNRISHRARAFSQIPRLLKKALG